MSYAELLKDPRWQRKRLEIMERDEWTCQVCGDTQNTLTVHHKTYRKETVSQYEPEKFIDPWDYEGADLITLCEECHSIEEVELHRTSKSIYSYLRRYCDNADALSAVCDYVRILAQEKYGHDYKKGVGNLFGDLIKVTAEDIFGGIEEMKNKKTNGVNK